MVSQLITTRGWKSVRDSWLKFYLMDCILNQQTNKVPKAKAGGWCFPPPVKKAITCGEELLDDANEIFHAASSCNCPVNAGVGHDDLETWQQFVPLDISW